MKDPETIRRENNARVLNKLDAGCNLSTGTPEDSWFPPKGVFDKKKGPHGYQSRGYHNCGTPSPAYPERGRASAITDLTLLDPMRPQNPQPLCTNVYEKCQVSIASWGVVLCNKELGGGNI